MQINRFWKDDSNFEGDSTRPERLTQEKISDLILPKDSSDLLASRLKKKNPIHLEEGFPGLTTCASGLEQHQPNYSAAQ